MAVPVGGTRTSSVAPVMALLVPGLQKPPRQVGKQFRNRLVAAPGKEKVKRPGGLRTRPAWLRQDRLGASPADCRCDAGCAYFHSGDPDVMSVGVSVQQYSVQCKGYNLIGVTTVKVSATRGTTALVYCLINSSLYAGTVQGW